MKVFLTKTGKLVKHGTVTGYGCHKCRCDLCSIAQSVAKRKYNATYWKTKLVGKGNVGMKKGKLGRKKSDALEIPYPKNELEEDFPLGEGEE